MSQPAPAPGLPCPFEGCARTFANARGLARHKPSHSEDKKCPCGWVGRNLVVHQEKTHGISGETTKAFASTAEALIAALKREERLKVMRDRDRAAHAKKEARWTRELNEARQESAALRARLDACLAGDDITEERDHG